MVATNAALASGGITHCCLRCGLRMFFLASARSCCRWRARQCAVRQPSPRADAGSIWPSLPQQVGGTLAFANQLVESISFLRVEPDHVFLDGNLFPGHESPPSLPCRDRDSEIPVMINDGGD